MTHKVDDTLRDDGRREISQITGREVNKVIPEHFKTDYPKSSEADLIDIKIEQAK